jgi:hypothetical protein
MTPEQEAKLDQVLQHLDTLTSLVRGLDTKLMFIQQDLDETKINTQVIEATLVDGVKTILKNPGQAQQEQKNTWVVEKL